MEPLTGLESLLAMSPGAEPACGWPWAGEGQLGAGEGAGEGEEEPLPQYLDPTDWEDVDGVKLPPPPPGKHVAWPGEPAGPYHASVGRDRRTLTYVGRANHAQDVGAAKADRPLPRRQALWYFEAEVLQGDERAASVCVGLAPRGFPLNREPGVCVCVCVCVCVRVCVC